MSHSYSSLVRLLAPQLIALFLVQTPLIAQLSQSSKTPPSAILVVSCITYSQTTNTMTISLDNRGSKPIIAYQVTLTFPSSVKSATSARYELDLSELVLNHRAQSGDDASWNGAILPGNVYLDSEAIPSQASLAGTSAQPPPPQAEVTAVLLADGTIQSNDSDGSKELQQYVMLQRRQEIVERSISTVLESHKDDADPEHRFLSVTSDLNRLRQATPQLPGVENGAVDMALANLEILKAKAGAQAASESYRSYYSSRHAQRLVLLSQLGSAPTTTAPAP